MDYAGAGENLGVAPLHLHLLFSTEETTDSADIVIVVVQVGRPRFNELLVSSFFWEES